MPASEAANSRGIAMDSPVPAVKAGAFLDPRHETRDMRFSARRRFF